MEGIRKNPEVINAHQSQLTDRKNIDEAKLEELNNQIRKQLTPDKEYACTLRPMNQEVIDLLKQLLPFLSGQVQEPITEEVRAKLQQLAELLKAGSQQNDAVNSSQNNDASLECIRARIDALNALRSQQTDEPGSNNFGL